VNDVVVLQQVRRCRHRSTARSIRRANTTAEWRCSTQRRAITSGKGQNAALESPQPSEQSEPAVRPGDIPQARLDQTALTERPRRRATDQLNARRILQGMRSRRGLPSASWHASVIDAASALDRRSALLMAFFNGVALPCTGVLTVGLTSFPFDGSVEASTLNRRRGSSRNTTHRIEKFIARRVSTAGADFRTTPRSLCTKVPDVARVFARRFQVFRFAVIQSPTLFP
jgi:hypothetical protein